MDFFYGYYNSDIGLIKLTATDKGLVSLDFIEERKRKSSNSEIIDDYIIQLDEYFKGIRKQFSIKLILNGTEFQKDVWKEVGKIKYGKTKSYEDIAISINRDKACRAVGNANNKNSIPIIIPCHRVIGKNGALVGYGSGLWRKKWLLDHERKFK
jgi:methylated-DNA-[protein]-cysteine S-methyltransferase